MKALEKLCLWYNYFMMREVQLWLCYIYMNQHSKKRPILTYFSHWINSEIIKGKHCRNEKICSLKSADFVQFLGKWKYINFICRSWQKLHIKSERYCGWEVKYHQTSEHCIIRLVHSQHLIEHRVHRSFDRSRLIISNFSF